MKVKIDLNATFPLAENLDGDFNLFVNGFNDCERVKYGKELNGQTNRLKDICHLSERYDKIIISAFDTDNYGILKQSAGVFYKGKLLGISDTSTVYADGYYMPGCGGKLYQTDLGKIGLAVGDDVYSFSLFKALAVCGAELIVAPTNFKKKEINSILTRAYAFLLGVPIVLLYSGGAYASDAGGNPVQLNEDKTVELSPYTEYVLKITKTRFNR